MANIVELEVGHQWERSVFGRSSDQCRLRFQPMSRIAGTKKVIAEQCNVDWNPEKPKTTVGQEILSCVKSYLPRGEAQILKMYSAIGTVLDFQHNIDGFFMLRNVILPIDLKAGTPPPSYKKGSFLLMMKECNGIRLWRSCHVMASILQGNDPEGLLYTVN